MEILLDRTGCSRSYAALLVINHLRNALHHETSLKGYRGIARDGAVRPGGENTDFSFPQSKLSNCYELKAVPLWDFELPSKEVIFDEILLWKCEDVLLRHEPAVFIGFARDRLIPNLLYDKQIKELLGLGGIMPDVEVCHIGEIRLDLAIHVVATSLQSGRLRILKQQGWVFSEEELGQIGALGS